MRTFFPDSKELTSSTLAVGNWLRLAKVYSLVSRAQRKKVESQSDCTLPQFDVLAQLLRSDEGMTFVELSQHLVVTSGNLTGIVDRLEVAGYVQREPDTKDRRLVRVVMTARGRNLMEQLIPKVRADIEEIMSVLSRSDQAELRRILGILRESLRTRT